MFVYQYILIVHLSTYSVLLFICPLIVSVSLSFLLVFLCPFLVNVSLSSCCCPAIRADFTGVLLPHTSSRPNSNAQPHSHSPPRIAHIQHPPRGIAHIPHPPRIAHIHPSRRPQCRHESTGCTLQTTSSPKHYILIVT